MYVAALDPRHGAYRPRMGISEGWVPGRVSLDQDTNGQHCGEVSIHYSWPHFFTKHGRLTNNSKPYCDGTRLTKSGMPLIVLCPLISPLCYRALGLSWRSSHSGGEELPRFLTASSGAIRAARFPTPFWSLSWTWRFSRSSVPTTRCGPCTLRITAT